MWQISRNWKAKFGPALVLALVACSVTARTGGENRTICQELISKFTPMHGSTR